MLFRSKPVIAIKAGRYAAAARAAASHTGALAGVDAVYAAAFRRAGILRVNDLDEVFDAVETLAARTHSDGERLAILTNGGGVGVLAMDRLEDLGLRAAKLDASTIARLDAALPPTWSRGNPVDIIGDAGPERYAAGLEALFEDSGTDAILALQVPTALARGEEAAKAVIDAVDRQQQKKLLPKPVFAAWIGAFVASATPKPIVERLNAEMKKALDNPEVVKVMSGQTLDPMYLTSEQFAARLKADFDKYEKLVKMTGVTAN